MTISKLNLPSSKITSDIGNLFSKIKFNSASVKKNITSGLTVGKSNESLMKQVEDKKKSTSYIQSLLGREVVGGASIVSLIESLKGMEKGGPVQSGRPYLVGESGPEVMIPSASGQVITNNNLKSIMPDRNIQQLNRNTSKKKMVVQPIITTNRVTRIIRT